MRYKVFSTLCVMMFGTVSFVEAQVVEFRLETTDNSGSVIDTINQGEQFLLTAFGQQIDFGTDSPEDSGIFAAYMDVSFDASLASVAGSVEFNPDYPNGMNAEFDQVGLIDNVGSIAGTLNRTGESEIQLWSLLMLANDAGNLEFASSESGVVPVFEVLVFPRSGPVDPSDITFGSTSLTIVPEPSSLFLLLMGWLCGLRRILSLIHI